MGAIDLPIARERPTGIPLVPGSSAKGALRARSKKDDPLTRDAFGPETATSSEHAGSVQLSDAHLLLLPVRSVSGTFVTTSPYLLSRFARDAREAEIRMPLPPAPSKDEQCLVVTSNLLLKLGETRRLVLEDLDFEPMIAAAGTALPEIADLLGQLLFPDGEGHGAARRQSQRRPRELPGASSGRCGMTLWMTREALATAEWYARLSQSELEIQKGDE